MHCNKEHQRYASRKPREDLSEVAPEGAPLQLLWRYQRMSASYMFRQTSLDTLKSLQTPVQ